MNKALTVESIYEAISGPLAALESHVNQLNEDRAARAALESELKRVLVERVPQGPLQVDLGFLEERLERIGSGSWIKTLWKVGLYCLLVFVLSLLGNVYLLQENVYTKGQLRACLLERKLLQEKLSSPSQAKR